MMPISEIYISGDGLTETARHRLEYVFDVIEDRRSTLDARASSEQLPLTAVRHEGPAFVAHLRDLPGLLDDDVCCSYVAHLARHGGRNGAVGIVYGDEAAALKAAEEKSTDVSVALQEGRALRLAPSRAVPAEPWQSRKIESVDDATYYSELLSAELWAALVMEDHGKVSMLFDHLRSLGEMPAGPTERRLVADALRRAADTLLPGSGGMLPGGLIACPLCLASPMLRPDEVPSHLVATHANLAEGLRS